MEDRLTIENNIENWTLFNIGNNFKFRPGQKEAIIDIIDNIINDDGEQLNKCHVIEAPTGSGKSLINIISAGVLNEFYKKRSYILASDLTLWKQYYDFIQKNRTLKNKIGCLKGQTGNYICIKNGEDLRNCECRMAGLSWAQLYNSESARDAGFDCAIRCKYLKERKKALRTPITLMTYQLFFYVVDIQNDDERVPVFDHRDVLFCDECHNIPNIVQMQYSPNISPSDVEHLYKIYNYCNNIQLDLFGENHDILGSLRKIYGNINDVENAWKEIWETSKNYKTTIDEDFINVMKLHKFWNDFCEPINNIEDDIMQKLKAKIKLTPQEREIYRECTFVENYLTFFRDFSKTISIVGKKYLVKQINEKDGEVTSVTFNCAKEDYMVYNCLLTKTPYKVMVSATVGDKYNFEDNIGVKYFGMEYEKPETYELKYNFNISEVPLHDIENAKYFKDEEINYIQIPSYFDFSKSPINFLNRYKMSYVDREKSLKSLKPIIYKICNELFKDKKGIIQTGSYQIAKEIIDNAPPEIKTRFLYYNGSREKNIVLTKHQMSSDTILIGPTLFEGIDLPGDDCRFIIILKVPFPQLKDRLVNAKMEIFPRWYNSTTSNSIIQGIGRGVRYNGDYCTTYILDACFFNLYNLTQDQYPEEIRKRIKIYK